MALLKNHIPDKPTPRPTTTGEKIQTVEMIYQANRWSKSEHLENCRLIGIEAKPLSAYLDHELNKILADFENFRMVIFEPLESQTVTDRQGQI